MSELNITICISVPLLLLGIGMFVGNIFFMLRAEKTTGIIVDYEARRTSRGGSSFAEVVDFQGPDGKTIRFVEKSSRSRFVFKTGHSVEVLYDPNNPQKARVNSFIGMYTPPMILIFVSTILILFNLQDFSGLGERLLNLFQDFSKMIPF